jgi:predicted DNA-binding transcriptional regulator AlpA
VTQTAMVEKTPETTHEEWVSVETVADRLGCSTNTVRRLRYRQNTTFPQPLTVGKRVKYPWHEIEKWVREQRNAEAAKRNGSVPTNHEVSGCSEGAGGGGEGSGVCPPTIAQGADQHNGKTEIREAD